MKIESIYFLVALTALFISSCIENEDNPAGSDFYSIDQSHFDSTLLVDKSDTIQLAVGTVDLESFQNEFSIYFDHYFDFGWRYITANYEEYAVDSSLEHTEVKRDFDLTEINAVSVEGDEFPIDFNGYAHSYQYVNGGHIYVTYIIGEISEELHYYYVNAAFEILQEGSLANSGGDEGSWSYSYGEFSKDFSVYQISSAAGEGLDTSDFSTDKFYFD